MSRFSETSKRSTSRIRVHEDKAVTNFMNGISYEVNPLLTLKLVASSSIFGEPSYYRNNASGKNFTLPEYIRKANTDLLGIKDKSTDEVFLTAIKNALDYDYVGTLKLALELREEYNMRLNPSIIFVEAIKHKDRAKYNTDSFVKFCGTDIIKRPDDMKNMFDWWMYTKKTKNKIPSVLKRVWAHKLQNLSAYHANKYKSKGLIDLVRISHPKPTPVINELMSTGNVKVDDSSQTWESLKSQGKSWEEILSTINIPHMALLRNLRGIFKEIDDTKICKEVLEKLKGGVAKGKQFPFRYYTAFSHVNECNHAGLIKDALEECIDLAMVNFPTLNGKTMSLSDNSGSAHGSFNSEYGSVRVSDIANLSSVMTGFNSDEGHVGIFGDKLKIVPVSKRNGILTQHRKICSDGRHIGQGTENGIWIFWRDAIKKREHWDNVFIYSDMQAGHGGLYGLDPREYSEYIYNNRGRHINLLKLVEDYRSKVNPKVNVYSVQVAGYNNSVMPENHYRTSILSGWTGKEVVYADFVNSVWDQIENHKGKLNG